MKKNRKMMKSTLAMLLVFALFLPLLAGCGGEKKGGKDSGSAAPTENTDSSAPAETGEKEVKANEGGAKVMALNDKYTLDGNDFELASYCLMEDSDGDTDIVMTWKFTNNEKEAKTSLFLFFYDFYQGKEQVNEPGTIFLSKDSTKSLTEYEFNEVEPGETGTFFLCYKLKDKKTPVKAVISGLSDKDKFEFEMPIEGLEPVTVDALDIPE